MPFRRTATDEPILAAVKRHLERTFSASEAASKLEAYKARTANAFLTNREARVLAKEIAGAEVAWDWDLPRTKEGYYHYNGGVEVRSSLSQSWDVD